MKEIDVNMLEQICGGANCRPVKQWVGPQARAVECDSGRLEVDQKWGPPGQWRRMNYLPIRKPPTTRPPNPKPNQ